MKLGTPKGTRDFLPKAAAKRQFIFNTLRAVFEKYAYQPIETPAMELSETLMGKYGEEGDRLIFKILSRGEKLQKALAATEIKAQNLNEEALRYDLTVPFARFVVQHQNDLQFPFKRYQIQPVWRADRPQKGRYREFYQCDIDVIGSDSLSNEVELIYMTHECFSALGLSDVLIHLNNRKILQGIAIKVGQENRFIDITVAIDKVDKIGWDGVKNELLGKGFSQNQLNELKPFLSLSGSNEDKINFLTQALSEIQIAQKGISEVKEVLSLIGEIPVNLNLSLARGLNYYTGAILEVTHPSFNASIAGGGRYDDLTGIFGLKDVSGVGISFGADRIFDLMESENLFPDNIGRAAHVLFLNFGKNAWKKCFQLAIELRKHGFSAEVYPDEAKPKKQLKYANDKGFPYVVFLGDKELEEQSAMIKNMSSGQQFSVAFEDLVNLFDI